MSSISDREVIEAFIRNDYALRKTSRDTGVPLGRLRGAISRAENAGTLPSAEDRAVRRSATAHEPRTTPGNAERTSDDRKKDGSRVIEMVTHANLRTEEEVIEHCEIDLSRWAVIECKIVSHKQGQRDKDRNPRILSMVNVTLRLAPRTPVDPLRAKVEVKEILREHAPRIPKIRSKRRRQSSSGVCVVSSIPDIHFGKHCDAEETGDDYNLAIARELYLDAKRDMLERVTKRYDQIDLIVDLPAHDLMHFTGTHYTTTNGTRQDAAAGWKKTYRTARETAVDGILMEREVAPVKVISIEDNHARAESFHIGDAIDCYFHKDDRVEVDSRGAIQKFHRYGNVLLGLHHGDTMKMDQLVGAMVQWVPKDFAECTYREWLLGHLHKEMLVNNEFGLFARRLPSLSGVDNWHALNGYFNTKSAMTLVYNDRCLEDILYYTPDPEAYSL